MGGEDKNISRKAAASAVELIRRETAAKSSGEFGNLLIHSLFFFPLNLHNLGHRDKRDSAESAIDSIIINDVDYAICLF